MPGIIAAWVFGFTGSWSNFLFATVLITRPALRTVPLGMTQFLLGDIYLWGPLMAMAVISAAPALILFVFAQRYLVKGLTAGAVKG